MRNKRNQKIWVVNRDVLDLTLLPGALLLATRNRGVVFRSGPEFQSILTKLKILIEMGEKPRGLQRHENDFIISLQLDHRVAPITSSTTIRLQQLIFNSPIKTPTPLTP